jgi:hypothetical protein
MAAALLPVVRTARGASPSLRCRSPHRVTAVATIGAFPRTVATVGADAASHHRSPAPPPSVRARRLTPDGAPDILAAGRAQHVVPLALPGAPINADHASIATGGHVSLSTAPPKGFGADLLSIVTRRH